MSCFNPLDRGNLYLILFFLKECNAMKKSFNPLDRGNLYLIKITNIDPIPYALLFGFNPLDRGNLYLIQLTSGRMTIITSEPFQSPRSGKFVSNKQILVAYLQFQAVSIP